MQAGVDEVGRGCLAGPVVAAAVVLFNEVEGLKDSKQLTPIKRNRLCDEILENGITGIGISSNVEVDEINIHQASLLAMERASCSSYSSYQAIYAHLYLHTRGVEHFFKRT